MTQPIDDCKARGTSTCQSKCGGYAFGWKQELGAEICTQRVPAGVLKLAYRDRGDTSLKRKWEAPDDQGRVLDQSQFPELNALFYTASPSDFIRMRINVMALIAAPDSSLAPAFAVDRELGSVRVTAGLVPGLDLRLQYMRTETVAIVHHASETLLRLYFAHIDYPECPWLGIAATTNFKELKERVGDLLDVGFDRESIARLFLGGIDPSDAGIDVTQEEFDDTVKALSYLLWDCGCRFIDDAYLYNAVKHGLTAIDLPGGTPKMQTTDDDGTQIPLHGGPAHIYLHKNLNPSATALDGQWFVSMDDSNPERDLAVAYVISQAIESLWAVAQRRYIGQQGSVWCLNLSAVHLAIYGPVDHAMKAMRRMSTELTRTKPDATADQPKHHITMYDFPDNWDPQGKEHKPALRHVELPLRPQDPHTPTTAWYLPFVRKGFQ